jgi:putative ABC transport system ATP-binding protein
VTGTGTDPSTGPGAGAAGVPVAGAVPLDVVVGGGPVPGEPEAGGPTVGGAEDDERTGTDGRRGAVAVVRRGVRVSPELAAGLRVTVVMALASAAGRIALPVLIQQTLDRGVLGEDGFDGGFVVAACAVAALVVVAVFGVTRIAYLRLVRSAEATLANLRVRAFAHIHRLALADLDETRRGVLTSRVTSDIETIARFAQWGAVAWLVNPLVITAVVAAMAVYSWQLTLCVLAVLAPMGPILRALQRRQLAAYDEVRNRVGATLTAVSETVMGAGVIRAYGVQDRTRGRLRDTIGEQYRAEAGALRYVVGVFSTSELFTGLAVAVVIGAGVAGGTAWGLGPGSIVAFVFLVSLVVGPIMELNEVLDQTQTAVAGWRRVLDVLDLEPEVVEPDPGVALPAGALEVRAEGVGFAYRGGPPVLTDVDLVLAAGSSVAVVGETGSGKTTFVKLLARLADPRAGRVVVGGLDLRSVAEDVRHHRIRMVPQDGFLFDASVGDNVALGRPGASAAEVAGAFEELGLSEWVRRLPAGLDTPVGERGESLSVGERQLVALARAQLADPGLLILDEATSAVDPDTEQALTRALARLAEGRTTVSVAHRLSTAEAADEVLVFHAGRLVERGTHAQLVAAGGRYAELYASWLGSTRSG